MSTCQTDIYMSLDCNAELRYVYMSYNNVVYAFPVEAEFFVRCQPETARNNNAPHLADPDLGTRN